MQSHMLLRVAKSTSSASQGAFLGAAAACTPLVLPSPERRRCYYQSHCAHQEGAHTPKPSEQCTRVPVPTCTLFLARLPAAGAGPRARCQDKMVSKIISALKKLQSPAGRAESSMMSRNLTWPSRDVEVLGTPVQVPTEGLTQGSL